MDDGNMDRSIATPNEAFLRDELVRGDLALAGVAPVMSHLLAQSDAPLVNEALLARVQGMLSDIARQLIEYSRGTVEDSTSSAFEPSLDDFVERLTEDHRILGHCHALAAEGEMAERFHVSLAIDPVLSPLFQELIASDDPETAELAMTTLAAQSRFVQQFKRMALPLQELPSELYDATLSDWQDFCIQNKLDLRTNAVDELRQGYDEGMSRVALLARLVRSMGKAQRVALDLSHSGVALLATALGQVSGQQRELALISCLPSQFARLALGLRAGGLAAVEIAKVFEQFHPERQLPAGLDQILPDQAQSILKHSDAGTGR